MPKQIKNKSKKNKKLINKFKDDKIIELQYKDIPKTDNKYDYFKKLWIKKYNMSNTFKNILEIKKSLDYDNDFLLKSHLNMKYNKNNLLIFLNYYNNIYKLDCINDKYIYSDYNRYYINELLQNKLITFKNKKIAEFCYNKPYLHDKIKDMDSYNLINLKFYTEKKNDKDNNNFNLGSNINNLDNLLLSNNNMNLFLVRENIFKLTDLNLEKIDLLIINNDFIYPKLINPYTGINLIILIILVMVNKYLNKGGQLVFNVSNYYIDKYYEFYYLLKLMFKNIKIYNCEITKDLYKQGIFIIADNYLGNAKIEHNLLISYENLKELCNSDIYSKYFKKKYIDSYLNITLPKQIIEEYNNQIEEKNNYVLNNLKNIKKEYFKYLKNKIVKIKPTIEQLKKTIKYCDKYNLSIKKSTYKKIMSISEIKYNYDKFI